VVVADVGLGDLIWTSLIVFVMAMFAWLFILAVRALFHDHGLPGWAKAACLVGLVIFPLFGPLLFLAVRGAWVTEDSARQASVRVRQTRTEFERYGSGGTARAE
jgi:hypothetical protein